MSCKVLAICDSEHSYAELLTKQLLRIPGNRLEIRNFTDIEKLKTYAADKVMAYLVVSEKYKGHVGDIEALSCYYLTEDKDRVGSHKAESDGSTYIYRYQPAHEIYNVISGEKSHESIELNEKGSSHGTNNLSELTRKSEVEFIGIYQPVHRNGCTTVAKSISRIKGEKGKVLYVNLEEYPGHLTKELEEYGVELGEGNLGDMLYYIKQSKEMAQSRLDATVHKLSGYHILAPIGVSQELRQISWTEWQGFLEVLRESDYESVIFDIHSSVQGFVDLLEQCHMVYCPGIVGRESPDKHKNFLQEMRLLGKTQMLLKMENFVIPEYTSSVEAKVEEKLRKILET